MVYKPITQKFKKEQLTSRPPMKLSIAVATIYQAIARATVLVPAEPIDLPLPSDLEGINLKDIDLTFLSG